MAASTPGFLCPNFTFPLFSSPPPALAGTNDAEDCCLSVTQRPIPKNIVKAFRYLLMKDGCIVPAVV